MSVDTYIETILRYRVYRHEQLPPSHGGKLRKVLVFSYETAKAAWDHASELNRMNDRDFYMFSAEDYGKNVEVERPVDF